jgi:uncharacterized membrane protein
MTPTVLLLGATLAVVTYIFRAAGALLVARVEPGPRAQQAVDAAALLLLASVMATTALTDGEGYAGTARVTGVAVAALLAWKQAPLPLVLVAAATVTAGLRLAGVP